MAASLRTVGFNSRIEICWNNGTLQLTNTFLSFPCAKNALCRGIKPSLKLRNRRFVKWHASAQEIISINTQNGSLSVAGTAVEEAIAAVRNGEVVIVVDDEDRENEGDFIMAASLATPSSIAFFLQHTSGLICCALRSHSLERLHLPQMVPLKSNSDAHRTAFTLPVDFLEGCVTGMSAVERANTVRALATADASPAKFRRPGHIFPLRARPGGVLQRAGHTEAAADLAELAGLAPAGILCEVVKKDGSMARLTELRQLATRYGLHLVSIEELVKYRLRRERIVVESTNQSVPLDTEDGEFQAHSFHSLLENVNHFALTKGNLANLDTTPVYIHRECTAGEAFGSRSCGCGASLRQSMREVTKGGHGVVVYLRNRSERSDAALGCTSMDSSKSEDAVLEGGDCTMDARTTAVVGQILVDLGVRTLEVTASPRPFNDLQDFVDDFSLQCGNAAVVSV